MLNCSICGAPVSQDDKGNVILNCSHVGKPVTASMSAEAFGFSTMNNEEVPVGSDK